MHSNFLIKQQFGLYHIKLLYWILYCLLFVTQLINKDDIIILEWKDLWHFFSKALRRL